MKKFRYLFAIVGLFGLLLIWATGVDLVFSRVGFGMVGLGLAGGFMALAALIKPPKSCRSPLVLASLVGAGYFIGRALAGGPLGLAIPDVVQVLLFAGVYYLVAGSEVSIKRLFLGGLGVLCVVQLGVAAVQFAQGNSFYVWKANPEKLGSTTGLFGHYNPFAAFLNGSVFFFLSYFCLGRNLGWRVVCAILVFGLAVGVVMSGSRGGWVSLVVGMVVWIILLMGYLWQRKSKAFGPVLVLGIIVSVGGIGSLFWAVQKITEKRMEQTSEELGRDMDTEVTDGGRLAMQQIAFEIFLDSPAIGQGPRSFSYLSLENWDPDELYLWMGNLDFAHNEYLQALSDYGAIGLFVIVVLLIAHGVAGAFGIIWSEDTRAPVDGFSVWQLGAAGGLVAVLAQCFFSFLMHVPSLICLVALQLGVLVGRGGVKRGAIQQGMGRIAGLMMLGVAFVSGVMGWRFSAGFLSRDQALQELSSVSVEEEAMNLLGKLGHAGRLSWDPSAFEQAGQMAMALAMEADESRQPRKARRFREKAREAFQHALKLNPCSPVALCGLPQVEDAMGNFVEADKGHLLAMKKVWSREYHLRPYFHAARSAYSRGYVFYLEGDFVEAERYYRLASERIEKRREILVDFRELEDTRQMRVAIEGWLAYMEGERLFKEGDRVWKEARPRDPERAHALMLVAESRYQKSRKILEPIEPRWRAQWDQLQKNLNLFKLVKVDPAKLTPEEIETVAHPEAVLDSSSQNR